MGMMRQYELVDRVRSYNPNTDEDLLNFSFLLLVAGNETTRNAISHGMNAFLDNPDQWELFKKERPATAVDEIVRWATPVNCFQRTAKRDTQIGGVDIADIAPHDHHPVGRYRFQ